MGEEVSASANPAKRVFERRPLAFWIPSSLPEHKSTSVLRSNAPCRIQETFDSARSGPFGCGKPAEDTWCAAVSGSAKATISQ